MQQKSVVSSFLSEKFMKTTVTKNIDNLVIEYVKNTVIGYSLASTDNFEEQEIKFFLEHSLDHQFPVVLDVGANIGWHSIRWASQCKDAIVYAFEPSPSTIQILRKNVHKNRLEERVFVVEKAVSDIEGKSNFFECSDNAFSSLKNTKRMAIDNVISVPITTIDNFVQEFKLKNISLIKIDVEGYETEVIKGALKCLNDLKPDLFVEIYGGKFSNKDPQETIRLIQSLGYTAFVLDDGIAKAYVSHSDKFYNYYFTCKNRLFLGSTLSNEAVT